MLCMAEGYKKRLSGTGNPNYKKDCAIKVCKGCGASYENYNKTRKYCSHKCYTNQPKALAKTLAIYTAPKAPKIKKCYVPVMRPRVYVDTKVYGNCLQCGIPIVSYRTRVKKYCTYKCHLDSGGAVRAGKAAGTMTRKYGAKKDANHVEIVGAFEKLGAAVLDLSTMGSGVPDLFVKCREVTYLVDVKNPKTGYGKRGLNPLQKEWAEKWKGGPVYLISTVEQVADLFHGRIEGLKRFPE